MTKTEANKIKKWFQSNIGLLGWTIKISVSNCPPRELISDLIPDDWNNFCGRSKTSGQFHRAVIWVNPKGHEKKPMIDSEEETLIHELLHCFWSLVGMEEVTEQCEWANNRFAAVLMKQYRADNG